MPRNGRAESQIFKIGLYNSSLLSDHYPGGDPFLGTAIFSDQIALLRYVDQEVREVV